MIEKRILRRPEVEKLVGLSSASIYRLMDQGAFPRPKKLGVRAVGWVTAEIDAWLESRQRSGGWK